MKSICLRPTFDEYFGSLSNEANTLLFEQYPMLRMEGDYVTFRFDLNALFEEPMELFSVDCTMVSDLFTLNNLFSNEDINPELLLAVTDWLSDLFEYDPITPAGDICMTFDDVKTWYGDAFDTDMEKLYPLDYPAFKSYFSEN